MANFYTSPNMLLVVPTPTVDPGPDWAFNLNASLTLIDSHNHSPGQGVLIPTSGLNINADLNFNGFNTTSVNSVRFVNLTAPLSGPLDLGAIYESGGDLYYNNSAGFPVHITSGDTVLGSAGTIGGLPSGTASANYVAVSGTFVFQQTASTAANIDVGTVILRYPGSYPTPTGNYIAIEAPTTLNTGFALVLPGALPTLAAGSGVMILSNSGIITVGSYDSVGQGMTVVGADAIAASMDATGANDILNTFNTLSTSQANIIGTFVTELPSVLNIGTDSTTIGNQFPVMSGNSGQKVIYSGYVNSGGGLSQNYGISNALNPSVGIYEITWPNTLLDPTVLVSVDGGLPFFISTSFITATGCQVTTRNSAVALANVAFNITVYGIL